MISTTGCLLLARMLLEEPELSLHSAIVNKLAEIIAQMQKRKTGTRQVILSTHSYELLDNEGISLEEVIMLEPTKEGTEARLASSNYAFYYTRRSG